MSSLLILHPWFTENNVFESICITWKDLQLNPHEKSLERFGEVKMVDGTNGFGLDFLK